MTEKAYDPSTCESCGEQFGCGAKHDGCWCNDVELTKDAAESLKEKFKTCLCPKCLEKSLQQKKFM
ncbi:MAG: cysteine-rich CWC family protein [Pyrinomonadaceae bacterium]